MAVLTKIKSSNIADNAITTAKLANSTGTTDGVTTAKIATDAITAGKIGAGVVDAELGTIDGAKLADNLAFSGSYVKIPSISTTARDLLTPAAGMLIYNSTLNQLEQRAATSWQTIAYTPTITSVTPLEVISDDAGNVTFTVIGTNFQTTTPFDTVVFHAANGSANDITSGITTTVNSSTQLTVVVAKSSFVDANEPYSLRVTGSLNSGILSNVIRVDNAPTWTAYIAGKGTPPVVASIADTAAAGTHATVNAVDAEGDTVSYAETTSILTTAGMSLNTTTGVISGTPTDVGAGLTVNYDFTLRASSTGDGGATLKTTDQLFRLSIEDTWTQNFALVQYTGDGGDDTGIAFNESGDLQPDVVWVKSISARSHYFFTSTFGDGTTSLSSHTLSPDLNTAYTVPGSGTGAVKTFTTDGFTLGTTGHTNTQNEVYLAFAWAAGGKPSGSTYADTINKVCTRPSTSGASVEVAAVQGVAKTSLTCTTSNTLTTVTLTGGTIDASYVGFDVVGTGIPVGATVASRTDATHFVLSVAATASGTVTLAFNNSLTADYGTWNGTTLIDTPSVITNYKRSTNYGSKFSVLSYTTANTTDTKGVKHGLGARPEFMILKTTDAADSWWVWHHEFTDTTYDSTTLYLDTDVGLNSDNPFAETMKFSSNDKWVFHGDMEPRDNDVTLLAWIGVAGVSKFGSYTGNNGPNAQTLGFQPRFVMIKSEGTGSWLMFNSLSGAAKYLKADSDVAETTGYSAFAFTSTGFTVSGSATQDNATGVKYIYAAWA